MKRKLIPIILLVGAAAAVAYWLLGRDAVADGGLKVYGNVDIREVTLAFRVGGRVAELHRDEGEAVQAGDLLAALDAVPFRQQLEQAAADLELRRGQLQLLENGYRAEEIEQAEARLAEARTRLENAQQSLDRQEQLQANRAGTDQQLDDARARRDQAEAAVEVAAAGLRLLRAGFRAEEIAQARAAVRLAAARADEAATRLEDTRLLAPSAGTVRTRVVEAGAIVGAGAPVFVVSLQEEPWVRAYISGTNLGRIAPGMRVQVFTDSRPGRPYAGHIGFISPTAEFTPKSIQTEELRTNLVYRFRVILDESDGQLRQGMPVTVVLQADGEE